jgi:NMD protein affecting ribosome stability and mRNA decay
MIGLGLSVPVQKCNNCGTVDAILGLNLCEICYDKIIGPMNPENIEKAICRWCSGTKLYQPLTGPPEPCREC